MTFDIEQAKADDWRVEVKRADTWERAVYRYHTVNRDGEIMYHVSACHDCPIVAVSPRGIRNVPVSEQVEPREHVVALSAWHHPAGKMLVVAVGGNSPAFAPGSYWQRDKYLLILGRTEITFDATGRVVKQVMPDGEEIPLDDSRLIVEAQTAADALVVESDILAANAQAELADLKAKVLEQNNLIIGARNIGPCAEITRLCQPDAPEQEQRDDL